MPDSDPVDPSTAGLARRQVAGRRGPVLWIHGYTLDSSIWLDLWDRLPDWAHIGVDLPGHGRSPPLAAGADLPDLARQVGAVARAAGARHLVGLSFGAMVALQAAIELPGAFSTLIVGSPPLGGGPEDPLVQARSRALARLYEQRGAGPWMTELWMRWPPDIFKGTARHPELWEMLRAVVDRHRWEELGDHRMRQLVNHPQPPDDLRRIRAATLIIVGEDDMPSFKRCAELLRRAIPAAERVYAPGAGHLSLLECPTAPGLIASHLERHDRTSSTW